MCADLDRSVQVLEPRHERGRRYRLSELDSRARVVLLGEPGIGKSTTLVHAAQRSGTQPITVRRLLMLASVPTGSTLFIDALDQARTRDTADDRIDALSVAVREGNVTHWRLACRSEDWRGRADLDALIPDGASEEVCVVQLLPLQYDEAAAVLRSLGHITPESFLDRAAANGAEGFTESPLMLKLLHTVFDTAGQWPRTRFELFDLATQRLVAETNEEREHLPRPSVPALLDAAGIVSLLLLTTGTEGVWRSSMAPPLSDDKHFVTREVCNVDNDVLDNLFDSALFRGEGHVFEPVHRSIAEFLAGRSLAMAVVGGSGRAAYPLSRALALITDANNRAPTELRGVHAWLTVHLARLGRTDDASTLVEADPISALFYGDVASFDTQLRRTLLYALSEDDPYFRSQAKGDTAIAGLAGEDLAEDFRVILNDVNSQHHLMITVLDALAGGNPVLSLGDLLDQIAHDESRPSGHRQRAVDALLNLSSDHHAEARHLFDSISQLAASNDREGLRAKLLAECSEPMFDTDAVVNVLLTYGSISHDETIMRLYPLQRRLRQVARPDVLDTLANHQPIPWAEAYKCSELEQILNDMFVAALDDAPMLDSTRLLRWVKVLSPSAHSMLTSEATNAIGRWMDAEGGREIALFEAIRSNMDTECTWIANTYTELCGRSVTRSIIKHLVRPASPDEVSTAVRTRITLAVDILTHWFTVDLFDAYWQVYNQLEGDAEFAEQFQQLTVREIEKYRQDAIDRKREKDRSKRIKKRWVLRRLSRSLDKVRAGSEQKTVHHAARAYFYQDSENTTPFGIQRVQQIYGHEITEAIVERWCALATDGLEEIEAFRRGTTAGQGQHEWVELAAVAGIHWLLEQGNIKDCGDTPIAVLLCVFTQGYMLQDESVRHQIQRCALDGLSQSQEGLNALIVFWESSLDAGAVHLLGVDILIANKDLLTRFSSQLDSLLHRRPDLGKQALRETFELATQTLEPDRITELVEAALSIELSNDARGLWLAVGIELDPARFQEHLSNTTDLAILTTALAEYSMGAYKSALILDDPATRSERYALAIEYLGPSTSPMDARKSGAVTDAMQRIDVVNRAMEVLGSDTTAVISERTAELLANDSLEQWHTYLRHVLAKQAAIRRDEIFSKPNATDVRAALNGGPPLNAADLHAIIIEELTSMANTLHTDSTTPWKQFWNTDRYGNATEPRIENVCRDRILERLADRFQPYAITAVLPEALRGEGTRSDMLVLCGAGANLPVEVKRHNHADLWSAASTQLQG